MKHNSKKGHAVLQMIRRSAILTLVARGTKELIAALLPAVAIAFFVNVFVAEAALVEQGPSMEPSLYVGHRVLTEKITYRFHIPRRGDVVILERQSEEISLIKRVVGLPGELVEVRGGHTFIDGQQIAEPWVTDFGGRGYGPSVIPAEHVFILGDNRANSRDSREIGPVPISAIKGRVFLVFWPLSRFRFVP
jgi:signal peptidase I